MEKREKNFRKKGLSTVVTSLILILLVLVAVGVVWVVIKNVIDTGTEGIVLGKLTLDTNIESVSFDNLTNDATITIKREAGRGDMSGIKFIFSDGLNSEIFEEKVVLEELETRVFTFNLINLSVDNLTKVSIAVIIKTASGGKNTEENSEGLLAFPSAEGFGAKSAGGRGGKIIYVTNLEDSGQGSFREAVEQNGPRTIIFNVGGIIELEKDIDIKNPYITIAGQTALGDGICVKNAGIMIRTNDVIIRNLCSRPGDSIKGSNPDDRDAFKILEGYNIILDHVSASWAIDEGVSLWYSPSDVTIQWSIISENLKDSLHPKGEHSMGLLIGETAKKISIHHNIFSNNNQRNPLVKTGLSIDIVNNIIYNWGDYGTGARGFIGRFYGDIEKPNSINLINNYYKTGPSTKGNVFEFERLQDNSIFIDGNIGNAELLIDYNNNKEEYFKNYPYLSPQQFFPVTNINLHTAEESYKLVLEKAGAYVPKRNSVDARIIQDVKRGTGKIIDSPSDVGGYPLYETGKPVIDSDNDGMPDSWEVSNGLNPSDSSDGNKDMDKDGYTNVEEYLNELAGD